MGVTNTELIAGGQRGFTLRRFAVNKGGVVNIEADACAIPADRGMLRGDLGPRKRYVISSVRADDEGVPGV